MKNKGEIARAESETWTRAEDYIGALARRRTERKKREPKLGRTEPESPRLLLSTLPFIALMAALAVLAVAIIVTAWPGNRPTSKMQPAQHQQGYAAKGWFQEARREMRR
jgi:hypothetical protein